MDTRRVTFLAFRYGVLPISSFSASLCLVFYSTAVRTCSVCSLHALHSLLNGHQRGTSCDRVLFGNF
jgi:hypothetical protein